MMKWRLLVIFLLCSLSCSQSFSLEQTLPTLSSLEQETTPPNPMDLNPRWWSYFEIEEEKAIKERIQTSIDYLNTLQTQLSEEEQSIAETYLHRFQANLKAFTNLKTQEVPPPLVGWVPQPSYSLEKQIEIADKIRTLENTLEHEKETQLQQQVHIQEVEQQLQSAFAKYLEDSSVSSEKFLFGLSLMAQRSRLAFLKEELRLLKEKIQNEKRMLGRWKSEFEVALSNLDTTTLATEALEQNISEQKQKIEETQRELLTIETEAAAPYYEETPEARAEHELSKQLLIHAFARHALETAKLIFSEAKYALAQLIEGQTQPHLEETIKDWKAFESTIQRQMVHWKKASESESNLFSKTFLTLKTDKQTDQTNLLKINEKRRDEALGTLLTLRLLTSELYHIEILTKQIEKKIQEQRPISENLMSQFWGWLYAFQEFLQKWMYFSFFEIEGYPVTFLGVVRAFLILAVALFISSLTRSALAKATKKRGRIAEPTLYTLRMILHYLILLVGVLAALASIGLTVRNLALILGALSVGIGFGLQNIVNNFFSGVILLFERNVKIGDFVELDSGHWGKVMEIQVQNTGVHTLDGIDLFIPNSQLLNNMLVNWTKQDPYQRLRIDFGVAYGTDQDRVRKAACEAALKVPSTITGVPGVPEPEVWLVNFGESSLDFQLVVWVNIIKSRGRNALRAAYLAQLEKTFKEEEIHIPFPQRDLHFKTFSQESLSLFTKQPSQGHSS